jgi:outer membrane lipoprotein-sorting protein
MGTDFTFDDMGDREVEEDTHTRTGQETFEGKKCYIVESIPKEKNYIYSKKIVWVTDGEWTVPKIDFYDRKGRLLKHLNFEWNKVQDIWAWKRVTMKNVQTGHQTTVEVKDTKFNQGFKDDLFTQRTLRRAGK